MGESGYQRVMSKYKIQDMKKQYEEIYQEFSRKAGDVWMELPFQIKV
jgi:hypothetical protein